MSQGKILISISNKEVFLNLKKIRGFSSKTIEILLEIFFDKVNINDLWQKFYGEGEESYRDYIRSLIDKSDNNGSGKKIETEKQIEKPKKSLKINSSTFWQ